MCWHSRKQRVCGGTGCSEKIWWRGCGLLRDSDTRRIECQGKTRPEFSAATIGVDRWLKVASLLAATHCGFAFYVAFPRKLHSGRDVFHVADPIQSNRFSLD